jgi:electron transfer flavoprotein beta subunit
MPLNIIVLIKQVPDTTAVTTQAMKDDGTLNRSALPAVFNPDDMNALEMALDLRERFSASVTVLSMGPAHAAEVLRESLYMGADRAVLLTDRLFAGSDTLATSFVLSQAIRHLGGADLILCGREAIDGNTAQVGPQVAEKLDMNQITYVDQIEQIDASKCSCWHEVEQGRELVESKLPVLLTVTAAANTPRPFSAKRIMRYKNAKAPAECAAGTDRGALAGRGLLIEEWNAATIGVDAAQCGLAGSPTRVQKIESVVLAGREFKKFEPDDSGIRALLEELIADYTFD